MPARFVFSRGLAFAETYLPAGRKRLRPCGALVARRANERVWRPVSVSAGVCI